MQNKRLKLIKKNCTITPDWTNFLCHIIMCPSLLTDQHIGYIWVPNGALYPLQCITFEPILSTHPPPVSMASMRASVSLLRIQSMSCRWERSPELSSRRRPGMRPVEPAVDLGRALRPSNSSTSSRSTKRMVSRTQRSSPCMALSMESGRAERNRSYTHTHTQETHTQRDKTKTPLLLLSHYSLILVTVSLQNSSHYNTVLFTNIF